jgi:serine-type D-Ala-D-Ala carboxypeptidase/endopeptidase (penicillin-binding protein 4)
MIITKIHLVALAGVLALFIASGKAHSAELASFCYLNESDPAAKIQGVNVQALLPIASVSKVMTSWWAVATKGLDYRFEARVSLTPQGDGSYNMHIEGSRDPYFGIQSLQFLISELNKRNITQIHRLTYDENFKFFWDPTESAVAIGHYGLNDPGPSAVQAQLSLGDVLFGYADTLKYALREKSVQMVADPTFTIDEISYQPSNQFHPVAATRVFKMHSAPIANSLKEMTRNSNNNAANQIFQHLGGAAVFQPFVSANLGLDTSQLSFVNGSGDSLERGSSKLYNKASCSAVIKVLQDLRKRLKATGHDLETVLALSGGDETSTVSRIYNNDLTDHTLVAKTGTVTPDVTLGGLVHTQSGDVYFLYNMYTQGTVEDWREARSMIRTKVIALIKGFNGGKPVAYKAIEFMDFDKGSALTESKTPAATQATVIGPQR